MFRQDAHSRYRASRNTTDPTVGLQVLFRNGWLAAGLKTGMLAHKGALQILPPHGQRRTTLTGSARGRVVTPGPEPSSLGTRPSLSPSTMHTGYFRPSGSTAWV